MARIKRFIECLLPVTACNLKCEYCYVIQENRRKNEIPALKYSIEHIRKALSKERLGGACYISICAAGETLLPKYMVELIDALLQEGHYINITNNGTMTARLKEICELDESLLKHLHFAFSFHYIELKEKGLLETFFSNVNMVRAKGCSFVVQINLYDGYLPYLEEIKELCLKNVGAYPQVAATRDESNNEYKLLTNLSKDEYKDVGDSFHSPLFDFTMKNFMVKRKEFCYAGDWSFLLNLQTGIMSKCYMNLEDRINIFENIDKPIPFEAIGKNCKHKYCINSSHFLSLGVIPSKKTPSYAALRNRKEAKWYTEEMEEVLGGKLQESNKRYSWRERSHLGKKNALAARIYNKLPEWIKNIYRGIKK